MRRSASAASASSCVYAWRVMCCSLRGEGETTKKNTKNSNLILASFRKKKNQIKTLLNWFWVVVVGSRTAGEYVSGDRGGMQAFLINQPQWFWWKKKFCPVDLAQRIFPQRSTGRIFCAKWNVIENAAMVVAHTFKLPRCVQPKKKSAAVCPF